MARFACVPLALLTMSSCLTDIIVGSSVLERTSVPVGAVVDLHVNDAKDMCTMTVVRILKLD
jgi:hypothetical protein